MNKMKKIPIYILMLTLLAGVFIPISNIQAQANCTYDSDKNTPNNAPCKDAEGNTINASGAAISTKTDTNYNLLEPIPCTGTEAEGCKDGKLVSFDPTTDTGNNKLGTYLNIIIRLFIGLCAVAAVVMIVIGGIEYSTSELISNKEAAKERIRNALLGLLLALGAYTILYTINPDLLNTDVDISGVTLVSEGEETITDIPEIIPPDSGPVPAGSSGTCAVGVEKGRNKIVACKDVVGQLDAMLDAAKQAGLKLTGGGYRTKEQQIAKRIQNCGGNTQYNIYEKPNDQCRPPTAKPGTSRHESGKAVDFNCNGKTIKSRRSPCFVWLAANASRFGYYNYPKEPWHWSRDGR